jgi:DNA topoisomerase VI subunit B
MDFFSEKELVTQTGHPIYEWPQVIAKELIDNALDACEEANVAPIIEVTADACGISVTDNGPGLPDTTLEGALDFSVRASNREAYVAPDRGAQGNALKTIVTMPWVLNPEHGRFIVEAHGKQHIIRCGADPISQRPIIYDDVPDVKCKNSPSRRGEKRQALSGTQIRVEWGQRGVDEWPFNGIPVDYNKDDFLRIVEGFAIFNPHATIRLDWFGEQTTWNATNQGWQKWNPCRPTSPHWYKQRDLERLIGAYVTHDREAGTDRLVSEFVGEFDGLTGSQKRAKVLREVDLHRIRLSELVIGDQFDSERIAQLLAAMQRHTRPVNSKLLGIIGEEHMRSRLLALGVQPESFQYARKLTPNCKNSHSDGDQKKQALSPVPWVLESAFGWLGDEADDSRRIYAGANWSAAINNPFRSFGGTGEGLEAVLSDMKVGAHEPVVFVLHLADPHIEYTDRGKSALVIGGAA